MKITEAKLEAYDQTLPWVYFCQCMLVRNYYVQLRESSRNNSKYLTVCRREGPKFYVRFSDHPETCATARHVSDFDVGYDGTVEEAVESAIAFLG